MIGGILLLGSKHRLKLAELATAFAAGALLAAAFVDLLPEAFNETDNISLIALMILAGILIFFIMESTITSFHSHRHQEDKSASPVVPMLIIGDLVHGAIDGIAIAVGFLVDPIMGIVVTIAVATHEIPQEIGEFGLMLHRGVQRGKVLLIHLLTMLITPIAAVVFFLVGSSAQIEISPVLALVAGFFIYIAVSDIIPDIHGRKSRRRVITQSAILLAGLIIVGVLIWLLRSFVA